MINTGDNFSNMKLYINLHIIVVIKYLYDMHLEMYVTVYG